MEIVISVAIILVMFVLITTCIKNFIRIGNLQEKTLDYEYALRFYANERMYRTDGTFKSTVQRDSGELARSMLFKEFEENSRLDDFIDK